MNNIGTRIKSVRINQNLTLKELAELSGVGFSRISKFERGIENPGTDILKKIEQALGVVFDNDEVTIMEIDNLFIQFLDSLFYQDIAVDYFTSIIETNHKRYLVCSNYNRILLIKYVLAVLKNNEDQIVLIEELLEDIIIHNTVEEQLYLEYKGIMKHRKFEYDEGVKYLKESLYINKDEKINAMVYYHLSMYYKVMNMLEDANKYELKARAIFSNLGSFRRVISCDILQASVYIRWGNYKHALKILNTCLDSIRYADCDKTIQALILRNKSWVLILEKKYEEALIVLNDADCLQSNHSNVAMYRIWCYYCLKKYNQARQLISSNHMQRS